MGLQLFLSITVLFNLFCDWDSTERAMLGAIIGLQLLDVAQTQTMTCGGGYKEVDPFTSRITGDRAAWYETSGVKATILIPTLYFVGCHTSSGWFRKLLLIGIMGISAEPVLHNEYLRDGHNRIHIQFNYAF